jgi:DNA polymerase III gamma/tau subunit
MIETLYAWWTDALRAGNGVAQRHLPHAKEATAALATRFSTTEVLRRIRCVEELRNQLGRNIQEALAIEVAFLTIFANSTL